MQHNGYFVLLFSWMWFTEMCMKWCERCVRYHTSFARWGETIRHWKVASQTSRGSIKYTNSIAFFQLWRKPQGYPSSNWKNAGMINSKSGRDKTWDEWFSCWADLKILSKREKRAVCKNETVKAKRAWLAIGERSGLNPNAFQASYLHTHCGTWSYLSSSHTVTLQSPELTWQTR